MTKHTKAIKLLERLNRLKLREYFAYLDSTSHRSGTKAAKRAEAVYFGVIAKYNSTYTELHVLLRTISE